MKYFMIGLMVLGSLPQSISAAPFLFEKEYINHAWVYQHRGCLIDERGYVYKYNFQREEPLEATGDQISTVDIEIALNLLSRAALGKFTVKHMMYDAGIETWKGYLDEMVVKLKQSGDFQGVNSTTESEKLGQMLDQWCR